LGTFSRRRCPSRAPGAGAPPEGPRGEAPSPLPWPEKRREKLSSLGVDEGLRSRGRAVLWLAARRRDALRFFFFAKKERKHICGSGAATTRISEGLPKRLGARSMFFSLFEGGRLELTRHNERNRLAPVSL
jgi:hypothetical protein